MSSYARIDKATYDALVAAYRDDPDNVSVAARRAGVSRKTARKARDDGWDEPPWARPIKDILTADGYIAAAVARTMLPAVRSIQEWTTNSVVQSALERRAREAVGLNQAREAGNDLLAALHGLTSELLSALDAKMGLVREALASEEVTLPDLLSGITACTAIYQRLAAGYQITMQAERLRLGEAGIVTEARLATMPLDDALRYIRDGHALAEQVEQRRALVDRLQLVRAAADLDAAAELPESIPVTMEGVGDV